MSNLGERSKRADAQRNAQRILDAGAEALAIDEGASLAAIAERAGVSRATLYHHFSGREALLDALTDCSVLEVTEALEAARPEEDQAGVAIERLLTATWQAIGRYRGLMLINPRRLEPAELRARLAPAIRLVQGVVRRGQASGEFDPELPADWFVGVLIDLIHGAGRRVSTGAMDAKTAERALLRTARAALRPPGPSRPPGGSGAS